ncbi:MAG: hypothetical protein WD598_00940 [Acidimicrobiia bacterium]
MPILWADVDDEPGPASDRGVVERGAIALLSNYERTPVDPPSNGWLGHSASSDSVHLSGLWNVNHVRDAPQERLLEILGMRIRAI